VRIGESQMGEEADFEGAAAAAEMPGLPVSGRAVTLVSQMIAESGYGALAPELAARLGGTIVTMVDNLNMAMDSFCEMEKSSLTAATALILRRGPAVIYANQARCYGKAEMLRGFSRQAAGPARPPPPLPRHPAEKRKDRQRAQRAARKASRKKGG
jgi:hypothetical protein